jgi:hypothetical protein
MSSSSSFRSPPSAPPAPPLQCCSVSGHQSSLRCSKCLGALYCSVNCQKQDWKEHKVISKQAERAKSSLENQGCQTVEEIDAELEKDRRLAELGGAKSQYNVGVLYFTGCGCLQDRRGKVA